MLIVFKIGFTGLPERSRLSKDNANLSDNNSIRKNIHLNEKNHQNILMEIDKKGVQCFVCNAPLQRIKPVTDDISELTNVHPWEVIYECENHHVFSGELLIYLHLNGEF